MLYATNIFPGDGSTRQFEITFVGGYLNKSHVKAYVEDDTKLRRPIDMGTVTWLGPYTIQLPSATAVGSNTVIVRETPLISLVDFQGSSRITEANLDTAHRQGLLIAAESRDLTNGQIIEGLKEALLNSGTWVDAAEAGATTATLKAGEAASSAAVVASEVGALALPTGSSTIGHVAPGTGAVSTTVRDKLRERISAKDYGAVGGSNDTAAILASLTAAAGKCLDIESGTYNISAISLPANSNIAGAGKYLTSLKRISGTNLVTSMAQSPDVSGVSVLMEKSIIGNDGHGIVCTQPKSTVRNVSVSDFGSTSGGGGTGVLYYGSAGRKLNRLSDSEMIGNSATLTAVGGQSYGWIFTDTDVSFASGIYAASIREYAHELKNAATYNSLSNLIAEGSQAALGYGQDTGVGPSCNVAVGVVSKNCDKGFVVGYGNNNLVSSLLHDNRSAPGISTPYLASFESGSSYNAIFGSMAVGSFTWTVKYAGNANYAQIISHDTTSDLVCISPGAVKNATEIAHPGARQYIRASIKDLSGNSIRGANANPVWCHATGERVGSISGTFHDKLGVSGATAVSTNYWVKESDQYAVTAYLTPGNNGDIAGISYATPASGTQGYFYYSKGATNSDDYWNIKVGNVDSYKFFNTAFRTSSDNVCSLGTFSARWSTVYAATGAINTSDAREKQQVAELTEAEFRVAKKLKSLIRTYKFNDAVLAKGDAARTHFGVMAQDVKSAFESEGLVAERYAILCYDEWDEQQESVGADGCVVSEYMPAGNRYGVRYDELFAFIIGAL